MLNISPFKSTLEGMAFPAVCSHQGVLQLALLYQLEESQWWSTEALEQARWRQLSQLLAYACKHSPFYRRRLADIPTDAASLVGVWSQIPLLTREDLQANLATIRCTQTPKEHGAVHPIKTSGSTGQIVEVATTGLGQLLWRAFAAREHLWHQRDFSAKLGVIRYISDPRGRSSQGNRLKNWGNTIKEVFTSGSCSVLHILTPIFEQITWLEREQPDYLLSHPSILLELAQAMQAGDLKLSGLREMRAIGETLPNGLRELCQDLGISLTDVYSSQEVGYMALQCPKHSHYHLQSEAVHLEVLDDNNQPCAPGQIGRVVVTSLHNFATPIIRYDIGDYAELGEPCDCGRGLPVITQVMGRTRNLVVLPSGERRWPVVGYHDFHQIGPISQAQLVQKTPMDILARLVTERPLQADELDKLETLIHQNLGYPFKVTVEYADSLRRTANGKFEDFISEVTS